MLILSIINLHFQPNQFSTFDVTEYQRNTSIQHYISHIWYIIMHINSLQKKKDQV